MTDETIPTPASETPTSADVASPEAASSKGRRTKGARTNVVETPSAELPFVGEPAPTKIAETMEQRGERVEKELHKEIDGAKPTHPLEVLRKRRDDLKKEIKEVERKLRSSVGAGL
jgi:hypothetical protein